LHRRRRRGDSGAQELRAGRSVCDAVATAVRHTAPAIGAAGTVLAASFGTLMVEHDQNSKQTGFAMALGIPPPRSWSPRCSCPA
jgi:uncharacterized membrane protein YdfJ with MMPL/SSD domain